MVSEPAMSWVRASAVSSSRPSFSPLASRPSMRRARRSTRSGFGFSRRWATRAIAMPASFCTAARPCVKKGSGKYLA